MYIWYVNRRDNSLHKKVDKLVQNTCSHDNRSSFKVSNHSENKAGYDIFEVEYCTECRKHLSKEIVDFVSYKDMKK